MAITYFKFIATLCSLLTGYGITCSAVVFAPDEPKRHASFGNSISLSEDIALIGATAEDDNVGSAYLFSGLLGDPEGPIQRARLGGMDNTDDQETFGDVVSLDGSMAVVGAPSGDYLRNTALTSAYLYRDLHTATGGLQPSAQLIASDGALDDGFAQSVCVDGTTAMIGVPNATTITFWTGAAYVYFNLDTANGIVTESLQYVASDAAINDDFGWEVSMDSHIRVVTAPGVRRSNGGSGAAYLFSNEIFLIPIPGSNQITETAKLVPDNNFFNTGFGRSLSVSGNSCLIGAPFYSLNRGRVYYFTDLNTATETIMPIGSLTYLDSAEDSFFGVSVSLSGDTALVGAHQIDDERGAVFLYTGLSNTDGTRAENVKIFASDGKAQDHFGWAVSIEGDVFLIGAYNSSLYTDSAGLLADTGKVYTGSVSALTILDSGEAKTINGISFFSNDELIIGKSSDGNSLTLSEGDRAETIRSVYIGAEEGADGNLLRVCGTVVTDCIYIGAEGTKNNVLELDTKHELELACIRLREKNFLKVTGKVSSYDALINAIGGEFLEVWNGEAFEDITEVNFSHYLTVKTEADYTLISITDEANRVPIIVDPDPSDPLPFAIRNSESFGGGFYFSSWFGGFFKADNDPDNNFIFTIDFGWTFVSRSGTPDSLWWWSFELNSWMWGSQNTGRYFYSNLDGKWYFVSSRESGGSFIFDASGGFREIRN